MYAELEHIVIVCSDTAAQVSHQIYTMSVQELDGNSALTARPGHSWEETSAATSQTVEHRVGDSVHCLLKKAQKMSTWA